MKVSAMEARKKFRELLNRVILTDEEIIIEWAGKNILIAAFGCDGERCKYWWIYKNALIFFDTAPFIYYLEDNVKYSPVIDSIIIDCYNRVAQILTSLITYIEIMTFPVKAGHARLAAKYREFFTNSDNISVYPINLLVAEETIQILANYSFKHRILYN